MATGTINLPPGFVLDQQQGSQGSMNLPAGFVLDAPASTEPKNPAFLPNENKVQKNISARPDSVASMVENYKTGHPIKGTLNALSIPFQRAEAAVAGPALEMQKGNTNPLELLASGVQGAAGYRSPQLGDLIRTTGFGENVPALGFGNANELMAGTAGLAGSIGTGGLGELAAKAGIRGAAKLAPALKSSAEASYTKALGPTTKNEKFLADKVTPAMVESKPFVFTRGGLQRASERKLTSAAQNLEGAYQALPADSKVQLDPIIKKINGYQDGLEINGTVPDASKAHFDALDNMKADLINVMKDSAAPISSIRKYRQVLDEAIVESKKGFAMTGQGGPLLKAQREMANGIRGAMADQYPSIAKVNAEYSLWKNMTDLLETTTPKAKSTLSSMHAYGAEHVGPQAPYVGVFLNLGKLFSDNVAWNSLAGSMKSRIADLLASGKNVEANSVILNAIRGGRAQKSSSEVAAMKPLSLSDKSGSELPQYLRDRQNMPNVIDVPAGKAESSNPIPMRGPTVKSTTNQTNPSTPTGPKTLTDLMNNEALKKRSMKAVAGASVTLAGLGISNADAATKNGKVNDEAAIKTIIGEAENQGSSGMQTVASTIRNRGTLKGAYGQNAPRVVNKQYSDKIYQQAKQAWEDSKSKDYSGGSNHWFSEADLKTPKVQKMIKNMKFVKKVGSQSFYKEGK